MKISIKINKKVKNAKCLPQEVGSITFTQEQLEDIALKIYMLSEETDDDKFEYTASMDLIEVD